MAAPKVQTYEHAEIRVTDLGKALDFYTRVLGLHELAREDGVVYLGCGFDENYDLAVTNGGTGLAHFAMRVDDEEALARYRARLAEAGVRTERRDRAEPGQERAIRFEVPGGLEMELVLVADTRYLESYRPARTPRGIAPLDGDHVNVMSTDVQGMSEFLRDVLDFRWSDVIVMDDGHWAASWVRMSRSHHDVGVFGTDDTVRHAPPRRLDVRELRPHEGRRGRARRRGASPRAGHEPSSGRRQPLRLLLGAGRQPLRVHLRGRGVGAAHRAALLAGLPGHPRRLGRPDRPRDLQEGELMGELDGHVALVTGGGSGIGRGIVERFVAEGARVGVLDLSEPRLDELKGALGDAVVCVPGTVASMEDNQRAVDATVDAFGRLDTFIGNAAIFDAFARSWRCRPTSSATPSTSSSASTSRGTC